MAEPLRPEMVLNDRYRITKNISFAANHGVYLARDIKVTEKTWLIKEFFHLAEDKSAPEELRKREEQYYATLDVITNFDHQCLPKILDFFKESGRHYLVMEPIEGLTLKALSDMTPEQLPENQVLEWALQICDGFSYLHSRPKPFIGAELDPDHIMVVMGDVTNQIRLVNLGLNRFFDPSLSAVAFSTGLIEVTDDFYELGKTFYFLFTKKEYKPDIFFTSIPKVSEATNKIIMRLLSDEPQRNYRNASELYRDINKVVHPPAPVMEEEIVKPGREPMFFNFLLPTKENLDRAVFAVLSQKVTTFFAEIIVLLICIGAVYIYSRPGWNYTRNAPVVMCACKGEMLTFEWKTGRLLDRRSFEGEAKGMISSRDGNTLYISDYSSGKLLILNTLHNQIVSFIGVERNPGAIIRDDPYMFVLNETADTISQVSLDKNMMTARLPAGSRPTSFAFSRRSKLLYIADGGTNCLHIYDPFKHSTRKLIKMISGAGPVALSPDESILFICNTQWDGLTLFDTRSLEVIGQYTPLGLKSPSCIRLSPAKDELYILDRETHCLVVFSLKENKVTATIKIGKNPVDMTYDREGRIWVACLGSHNVAIVKPAFSCVESYINVGRNPTSILYVP